jgi:sugar (pentulose or hexulose) kinase
MNKQELLLGIDLGSSVLKATVIDESTGFNVTRTAGYSEDWIGEKTDHLERNVEVYWDAFKEVVRIFIQEDKIDPQAIRGLSFSVQGETFVPLDEHHRPLRKTLQGLDIRAQEEIGLLREKFPDASLYPVTGQPMIDGYWPAVKILWIKRHQPEIFARTKYWMLLEDYIIFRLTGRFVTDKSLIGDSYYYDMTKNDWYGPMLDFLGINTKQLPQVVPTGTVVGEIREEASRELGLSATTLVVTGAMDQMAGAVGAGNIVPGIITETTGTALALGVTGKGFYADFVKTGLPLYYHAVKDAFFLMPWLAAGGLNFQWFARNFCQPPKDQDIYDVLTDQAELIRPGSDGLIMLPFLSGATCPEFDSNARGVFFGITPGHTQGHFVRAILEAIGYAIRANLELIRSTNIPVTLIRSMGGGARSRLWSQIKADICGVPVSTMDITDTASLGAALIAGEATGVYPSLEAMGKSRFIKFKDTFTPNPENKNIYDLGFRKYQDLYRALKGVF